MRNIVAILTGLISGVFAIACLQWIGNLAFPADIPFPEKRIDLDAYMEHVPFMAKLLVVISYAAAGFVCGLTATLIQGRTDFKPTLIATATIQLLVWMNMMSFTHPAWMWIFGTLGLMPVGYLTYRKLRNRGTQTP